MLTPYDKAQQARERAALAAQNPQVSTERIVCAFATSMERTLRQIQGLPTVAPYCGDEDWSS